MFPSPDTSTPVSALALDNCHDSLLWSLWAIESSRELLTGASTSIRARLRLDPAFAETFVELYKLLVIDRSGARLREAYADQLLDRVYGHLEASGQLTLQSLGFAEVLGHKLPPMPEIDASCVALMRPRLTSFTGAMC